MKAALFAIGIFSIGAFLFGSVGCSTDKPGVTDTMGSYSTNVNGTPDKVVTAAQKACSDLKLNDIVGNGTKVDGKVTARTAQNDDVSIEVSQSGDKVSKVTIRVGAGGDEAISQQLIDRIKAHL